MRITSISPQVKNKNRVNISVDGKYRLSLDVYQLVDLGIKVGSEFEELDLANLEQESQFGKVYSRALEYCLMRPHSVREIKDYLYRKTRPSRSKTGELKPGVSPAITQRVLDRLIQNNYVDDKKFAIFWVDNRMVKKGVSMRKLSNELKVKGVSTEIIEQVLNNSERNDQLELKKIIAKKRPRYPDDNKFIMYLSRLGFDYDDIKSEIKNID